MKLDQLNIKKNNNTWLFTGDVKAFYSNIPHEMACDNIYKITRNNKNIFGYCNPKDLLDFINLIMDNNYFFFNDQYYKQIKGLAMGTPCAPTIANLFLAMEEITKGMKSPYMFQKRPYGKLICYFKYIDDIFSVFEGTKVQLNWMLKEYLQFPPLEIEYNYSKDSVVFLDTEIFFDNTPGNKDLNLHTKLFQKPMNKYLYIPWSSAHPEHVKKAFVKAKMTRYCTISSRNEDFQDCCANFFKNLRK